jgi:two-component system response regulator
MNPITSTQLILIAEDSDDDYEATLRAFKKSGNLRTPLMRCENGDELLNYLRQKGEYKDQKDWVIPPYLG